MTRNRHSFHICSLRLIPAVHSQRQGSRLTHNLVNRKFFGRVGMAAWSVKFYTRAKPDVYNTSQLL